MLQIRKEYTSPRKEHQEILNVLQTKLGQQVQISDNQVVEKTFKKIGNISNNQIMLKIINGIVITCEHLLLEKINGSDINVIHYEENIHEDCSTLFERLGYEMIKREEYQEKVYQIKFMNCSIFVQEQARIKKLYIQLRDTQDGDQRIQQLMKSLEKLLEQDGII